MGGHAARMNEMLLVPPQASDFTRTVHVNRPVLALVLYEGEGAFACKHRIYERAGKPVLGAAQGLRESDVQALLLALGARHLTPTRPNTLAVSPNAVAWWVPPGKHPLLFDAKYAQTASIARLSGVPVPLPGLVMIASAAGLRVFALRGDARPELDTPLMTAPVWNLFKSHVVCRGTAQYPEQYTPQAQEAWETVFFQSVFTGPSRSDRYMNWGGSYEELLEAAIQQGAFPEDVLVPADLTLRDVLEG